MSDKVIKYVGVALCFILGIFVGIVMTSKNSSDPALKRMIQQQTKSLDNIKSNLLLDQGLTGGDIDKDSMQPMAALLLTQQDLQKRLTLVETKVNAITEIFKNPQRGGGQFGGGRPPGPPPEDLSKVHKIDVGKSYIKGDKNAKVTIVAFHDFQCPFCARFHPIVNEVVKAYPTGVRYIIKNFPLSFHQQAKSAAKAALAAGEQGKYFEMVDLVIKNNRVLSDEKYREFAKGLGLDLNKFSKDLKEKDAQWDALIKDEMTLGGSVDVRGTPTFYINGKKTVARSLDQFKQEIDAILNEKK